MPIYQYECPLCNKQQEKLTHVISPPPPRCECGTTMKVVYCKPMLQFKGNGWESNDHKEKS